MCNFSRGTVFFLYAEYRVNQSTITELGLYSIFIIILILKETKRKKRTNETRAYMKTISCYSSVCYPEHILERTQENQRDPIMKAILERNWEKRQMDSTGNTKYTSGGIQMKLEVNTLFTRLRMRQQSP